jgi:hypothetical protein
VVIYLLFNYAILRRHFLWWSKYNCIQAIGILVIFFALQYMKNGSISQNHCCVIPSWIPCMRKLMTLLVQDNPRGWNPQPVEVVLPTFPLCQELMYVLRQLTPCLGWQWAPMTLVIVVRRLYHMFCSLSTLLPISTWLRNTTFACFALFYSDLF